jgi:glyoxylase-like metal-dependent hydrolase (beta-lactamase superfamily II)
VRVVATPGHTVGHQSVLVDMADGTAVMIGDAAYTSDIYRDAEKADLSRWPGQHSDREEWTNSLHKLHGLRPRSVHFCHDTQVVTAG